MKKDLQDSGVMERQIIAEEPSLQKEPDTTLKNNALLKAVNLANILTKLKFVKNRRFQISAGILIFIAILFLGFVALSQKITNQTPQRTTVKIEVASPQPSGDPELEQAKQDVAVFNNSLETLDSELDSVKFPQIDLDVKF